MTQIADEHGFCPRFIDLFLFAKQGKQTKETGKNDVRHCVDVIL
jgi:hypothetical protein